MAPSITPGAEIEFEIHTPCSDDVCKDQIARSISRRLPEATPRRQLTVLANGPSALDAPLDGTTLALNGALRLFFNTGRVPTYYACCDPQELVASFLDQAPRETIYYVASKCHPAVFDALRDRKVWLWHVGDYDVPGRLQVPLCSSITLSALWLFTRLGFTDFDIWGWDACYLNEQHHAGDAAPGYRDLPNFVRLNWGGRVEGDTVIGGETFDTTHTWAAEARAAEQFFQLADYLDLNINLHGAGMMNAVRRSVLGD